MLKWIFPSEPPVSVYDKGFLLREVITRKEDESAGNSGEGSKEEEKAKKVSLLFLLAYSTFLLYLSHQSWLGKADGL